MEDGKDTPAAVWARSLIPKLPRRDGGVRIYPKLAHDVGCRPSIRLIGTHRASGQKMVDAMLIVDTLHFLQNTGTVILISDDEDFSPAMMAAAVIPRARANLYWYRRRALGTCVNDVNLAGNDLLITQFEATP